MGQECRHHGCEWQPLCGLITAGGILNFLSGDSGHSDGWMKLQRCRRWRLIVAPAGGVPCERLYKRGYCRRPPTHPPTSCCGILKGLTRSMEPVVFSLSVIGFLRVPKPMHAFIPTASTERSR